METAIRFKNASGVVLHGILHTPDDGVARGAPGVLWLSAGQKVRQGAWRMNVAVARRLARKGVPTLRFDFHCIGDSEGDHRHGEAVMDLYGFIQRGGFRDDVVCGARFLMNETGVSSLVLGGLCGGGLSGLFAGPTLGRSVYGHVLVDLPVTISSAARQRLLEADPVELLRERPGEADTILLLYARKVFDPDAWRRLVSGESNTRLMVEAVRTRLLNDAPRWLPRVPDFARPYVERALHLGARTAPPARAPAAASAAPDAKEDGKAAADGSMQENAGLTGEVCNEMVSQAFHAALGAGQRVSFLNSSAYHPTFKTYFGNAELKGTPASWQARGFDLRVAPDTNHIFSLEHSQQCLFEAVESMADEATSSTRARRESVNPPRADAR